MVPRLLSNRKPGFLNAGKIAMALGGTMALPEMAHMTEPWQRPLPSPSALMWRRKSPACLRILTKFDRLLAAGGELETAGLLDSGAAPEANTTLGSKSTSLSSRVSVDMKVLIEQIREQVQNIE
jgi:hypothetical protein